MAGATRFIDKLKKAARLDPVKKEIELRKRRRRRHVRQPTDRRRTRTRQKRRPQLTTQASSPSNCWCVKPATATANPSSPPATSPS